MIASGEALVVPDRLQIVLGVSVRREQPGDALAGLSAASDALAVVLDEAGVADTDRRTSELSLHPDPQRDDRPSHWASSSTTVLLADFAAAAALVGRAGQAVGDALI